MTTETLTAEGLSPAIAAKILSEVGDDLSRGDLREIRHDADPNAARPIVVRVYATKAERGQRRETAEVWVRYDFCDNRFTIEINASSRNVSANADRRGGLSAAEMARAVAEAWADVGAVCDEAAAFLRAEMEARC